MTAGTRSTGPSESRSPSTNSFTSGFGSARGRRHRKRDSGFGWECLSQSHKKTGNLCLRNAVMLWDVCQCMQLWREFMVAEIMTEAFNWRLMPGRDTRDTRKCRKPITSVCVRTKNYKTRLRNVSGPPWWHQLTTNDSNDMKRDIWDEMWYQRDRRDPVIHDRPSRSKVSRWARKASWRRRSCSAKVPSTASTGVPSPCEKPHENVSKQPTKQIYGDFLCLKKSRTNATNSFRHSMCMSMCWFWSWCVDAWNTEWYLCLMLRPWIA